MKWIWSIVAVLLILVGIVWFLQGVNVIPGSFMSGNITYSFLGVIVAVIGVVILYFTNRRVKASTGDDHTRLDH